MAEFSSMYGVHVNQIPNWIKQDKEGIVATFSGKAQDDQQGIKCQFKELYATIGQLLVVKDFSQQAFAKI